MHVLHAICRAISFQNHSNESTFDVKYNITICWCHTFWLFFVSFFLYRRVQRNHFRRASFDGVPRLHVKSLYHDLRVLPNCIVIMMYLWMPNCICECFCGLKMGFVNKEGALQRNKTVDHNFHWNLSSWIWAILLAAKPNLASKSRSMAYLPTLVEPLGNECPWNIPETVCIYMSFIRQR